MQRVRFEQYEICHSCKYAFLFEPCTCGTVAPSSVRHGKEASFEFGVRLAEPFDTLHLELVLTFLPSSSCVDFCSKQVSQFFEVEVVHYLVIGLPSASRTASSSSAGEDSVR